MATKRSVIMVTGASKRLGRVMADSLAELGYRTIIHTQSVSTVEITHHDHAFIEGDLTEVKGLQALFDRALSIYGRIDHLINNASRFEPLSIEDTTLQEFEALMALHNTAPFFLSRALYLHLKAQDKRGSVINICDATLATPKASKPAYYTAKGALLAQSRALAVALGPTVRVNALSPGPILVGESDDSYFATMEKALPVKRTGGPADLMQAVQFLLESPFITGSELVVDGGLHLL